jgi:hypothetical protein
MYGRFVAPQSRYADIVLDSPVGSEALYKLAAMVEEFTGRAS